MKRVRKSTFCVLILTLVALITKTSCRNYKMYMKEKRDRDRCLKFNSEKTKCLGCEEGLIPHKTKCIPCSDTACLTCAPKHKCKICQQGHYLKKSKCKKCPKKCALCTKRNHCEQCSPRYTRIHNGDCVKIFDDANPEKITFWILSILMTSFTCFGLRSTLKSAIEKLKDSEFYDPGMADRDYVDVRIDKETELGYARKRKMKANFNADGELEFTDGKG